MLRQDPLIFRYLTLTVKYFEITGYRKKSVPLKRVTTKRNRFTKSADAKKPFLEKYGCQKSRSSKSHRNK